MKKNSINQTISDLGEEFLLKWLKNTFLSTKKEILLGVGDDCAILKVPSHQEMLLTTDSHMENVHFKKKWLSMKELGRRVMTQNLSDIAAMGGKALGALVALSAPPNLLWSEFQDLALGIQEQGKKYSCEILGGNLTNANQMGITITLMGLVDTGKALRRGSSKEKDGIFVTGYLGECHAGWMALEKKWNHNIIKKFQNPEPRIQESLFLQENLQISSMMDISDGLYQDLPRLLGNKGAKIEISQLPISSSLQNFANRYHLDFHEMALLGGEDFELLFTSSDSQMKKIKQKFEEKFSIPLTKIGQVHLDSKIRWIDKKEQEIFPSQKSFQHF